MPDDNRSEQGPAIPPAPQLSPEELNRRNPNHDAFWQARGMKKRPKDWKERIAREQAAKAKRLQQEQKAAARQARRQRERQAARDHQPHPAYDPFRRSRGADDDFDRGTG